MLKFIYSEQEATTITGVLTEIRRQREEWESFVEKRRLQVCLDWNSLWQGKLQMGYLETGYPM